MSDVPHETQPYSDIPPSEASKEARNWATLCHLSGLGIYLIPGIGHILGPLLIWLMKKNEYPFVDEHGKEALNFQITMSLYTILAGLSLLACIGIVLLPAVLIADLVLMI